MTEPRHAAFVFNLLQDINILRPLVAIARDLKLRGMLIVTEDFGRRDASGIWRAELELLCKATATPMVVCKSAFDAVRHLQAKAGILVAASESNLAAHAAVHNIFRAAPASFVRIVVQHGFEGVGLLQSREHDLAHGNRVTFDADVICSWGDAARLTSMVASQRSKVYVTGPPAVLQTHRRTGGHRTGPTGLVCENLHSVRLVRSGDFKSDFIDVFHAFCELLARDSRRVTLRPHPGGQYALKQNVAIPSNVTINNNPIYRTDLGGYRYGISAPSSVLLDMMIAGIPTAVWRDKGGAMDTSNYRGITEISGLEEWLRFSRSAETERQGFVALQQAFLDRQGLVLDPREVYARFADLFEAAARTVGQGHGGRRSTRRIMYIANGLLPTLQLSFMKPLAALVDRGDIETALVTEEQMKAEFGDRVHDEEAGARFAALLRQFAPDHVVFCRYSGPHAEALVDAARAAGASVVYHIDDDLLNIPLDVGVRKHKAHNDPRRLATVRYLLDNAGLVYCSTERLKDQLRIAGAAAPLLSGAIYCSGQILRPAERRPVRKVGYMASADHSHNLDMIMSGLVAFLRRHADVQFELFGSIPKPKALDEFGRRVSAAPPVRNYEEFLTEFGSREWDVGLCPLAPIPFNLMKANTKWVEYTSVGVAVVASRDTVYDGCCSGGCGLLAGSPDEWLAALERLTLDPDERFAQVRRAQRKLADEYSIGQLRQQVLDILDRAK